MRIIPGNTKVQIEIFKGVTLWDLLVGAIAGIMLALIVVSTLPYKLVFAVIHIFLSVLLLARIDKEPTYVYLLHIIRHFGLGRAFGRFDTDEKLYSYKGHDKMEVLFDEFAAEDDAAEEEEESEIETKAERKARLKAEKEEYKRDTKLLKSKKLSKEEEDAIWLKRAQQSQAKKEARKSKAEKDGKGKLSWMDIEEMSAFTGIKDGYIEYGEEYFGVPIEISSVEFRFFSEFRRSNSVENGVGSILRSLNNAYCANIVKIERPVSYADHLTLEYSKLEELRASYEAGFITEDELKARVAIVYDRIYELNSYQDNAKIVVPFYYLVLFGGDKRQLDLDVSRAIQSLKLGEIKARRLKDKEIALFLKYSNDIDFNEDDIENVDPEYYARWAMPEKLEFTPRQAVVNGMMTHNFRVVGYPTVVGDAWLATLLTYPSTKVVIKARPMDSSKAIAAIDKSLSELRVKASSAKTDSEAMEANSHLETLQILLSSLQGENESLLEVNIYITAYDPVGTNEHQKIADLQRPSLRSYVSGMKKTVRRLWQESGFRLNNMEFDQAMAYIGSQVSGYDPLAGKGRGIPSNSVAAAYPWVFPHVMDPDGIKVGTNDGVPVLVDFFTRNSERVNSNMVIVGKSGSGKSFATKALLSNLAADDAKIFILDPEDEYTDLAKNLHGKFINVANAQYGRLNPFHIITNLEDDEEGTDSEGNSYATHLQFLEEFFRQILPDCDRDSLEYLNALLDRVYALKGITPDTDLSKLKPADYPVFDDLYDEILKEFQRVDSDYVRSMLRTLMNYISKFSDGGRNAIIWNGPSTITTEENFTVFNFQSLLANRNSTVANAQMLLVLKYIDNEIIKNRDYNEKYGLNRKIVVVIDEAHVFIDTKYPVALDFMFQLAKRIRKYNGMQIVITQNIKDFVGSEEIARKSTAIINACQYSFIFALAPNDMEDLCKLYEKAGGINESEQEQIVQAPRGQAFVVMSPSSRTNIRVEVPEGVRNLFGNPNYVNPYFTGEGADENWKDYIGDSTEKRELNLAARGVQEAAEVPPDTAEHIGLNFVEMSEEEYVSEQEALSEPEPLSDQINFVEEFSDSDILMPAAESVIDTSNDIPAGPSRTEEMLAELTLKLGSQSMMDQIKLAVKEELEKEMALRGVTAERPADIYAAAEDAQEEADALFDILAETEIESDSDDDLAKLGDLDSLDDIDDDEIENDIQSMAEDEDADLDDDSFDVMAFLAEQAAEMEEEFGESDTSIQDFINGTATVIDVTLDQLISYNKGQIKEK